LQKAAEPQKQSAMKINLFMVVFDFELKREKIPAFRGAVVEKVGRENILFHQHLDDKFLYSYPLIQYKIIGKYPAILCLKHGTEEILKFFQQTDWDMVIHGQRIKTEIRSIGYDYFICEFSDVPLNYRIYNWFALNESNFSRFSLLENEKEKTEFLEKIMIGNILSFAKGIGWNVDRQIELTIPNIPKLHLFSFKKFQMTGFNLDFITNISIPDFIGLGKSVSRGFGIIRRV